MEVIIYLPKPSETISLKIVVTQELLNTIAFPPTFPLLHSLEKSLCATTLVYRL